MTPKDAMQFLIKKGLSKYRIARTMGMHPIMVHKYLKGEVKTMRKEAADALNKEYGVAISGNYINHTKWKKTWC